METLHVKISELMKFDSADLLYYSVKQCTRCATTYSTTEWWSYDDAFCPSCGDDEYTYDVSLEEQWEWVLNLKRADAHYAELLEFISEVGFRRPLRVFRDPEGNHHLIDGHHRIAVAIDLGMDEVPVEVLYIAKEKAWGGYAEDSGEWNRELENYLYNSKGKRIPGRSMIDNDSPYMNR